MRKPTIVGSVPEYIQAACDIRTEWTRRGEYFDPWFRGHSNSEYALIPSIFRLGLEDDENEIRAEFVRRGSQLMTEREPANDWSWYFLMQHYRAPTRLLDWTDGALIALYFALAPGTIKRIEENHVTSDAAVWVLDPWWLNGVVIGRRSVLGPEFDEATPYLPELYSYPVRRKWPVAIDPPHIARRVGAQRSRFTIHGKDPDGLTKLSTTRGARLAKIVLRQDAIAAMRTDLNTCGVSDATIFPDLEGLARELTRYYTEEW
jgi:hypothetical protein